MTLGKKLIAALPAVVVVVVLTGLIRPEADPAVPAPNITSSLKQVTPLADAHASATETSAFALSPATDPALAASPDEPQVVSLIPADDATLFDADTTDSAPDNDIPAAKPQEQEWETLAIRSGDSLSSLLTNAGIRAADWLSISRLKDTAKKLRRMQPGQHIDIRRDGDRLLGLRYSMGPMHTLLVERTAEAEWSEQVLDTPHRTEQRRVSGQIDDSLYLAARAMGLSDRLVMQMVEIFAWDVDFEREVRQGDKIHLIYEQAVHADTAEDIGKPRIVAAEYQQSNRRRQAFYYEPSDGSAGYFDLDGRPMKKAFLRTPVEFTRISSRFSKGRRHPVLNKIRAHRGVDYAAGRGTPIRATGAGHVAFAGTKGGYGRTIILSHGKSYKTLYAHMSRYARGIRNGTRVNQGQIIGYVGASGLATGPHLHYEFHQHGKHVDPLSVRLPAADPLPKSELAHFQGHAQSLVTELTLLASGDKLAQAQTP